MEREVCLLLRLGPAYGALLGVARVDLELA